MVKLTPVDNVDIGFVSLSRGTVDRSTWKFDEDGFAKANDAAVLEARQQMREAIQTVHADLVRVFHPSAFSRSVDGVDDASLDQVK